jgi:apoptosis-inducing factor 3
MEPIDLAKGIPVSELPDGGIKQGKLGEEEVIVARRGDEFFAIGAHCTHYGGALAEGILAGDEVRCPLHHAAFSLRTGEVLRAPAFDSLPCWRVERVGDTVYVRDKSASAEPKRAPASAPQSIVIVGGGAAGFAAADTLRKEGYEGSIMLLSADDSAPCDRPNLSKDYLAGHAPEEWIPLRPPEYYADRHINLVLNARVAAIDPQRKQLRMHDGASHAFDALLLATGAEPVRIPIPGASDGQLFYLRTLADSKALIQRASSASQMVVVGASFIGLEVAASLRERGLRVHIVAPEEQPLERVFGRELGATIRRLHESHGVEFHLGQTVARMDGTKAVLSGGDAVEADFLVLGVGVRPSVSLAEEAGLKVDHGIVVDEYLQTSAPGIYAAGDVARWPDPDSGHLIRIEHWVVAERQGQAAARNMLGRRERFQAVPFFWTHQFGLSIRYIGHAENWDRAEVEGSLEAHDCTITYSKNDRRLAVASISRDRASLQIEAAMEASIAGHTVGIA